MKHAGKILLLCAKISYIFNEMKHGGRLGLSLTGLAGSEVFSYVYVPLIIFR
jgi:hypothetical protein